MANAKYEALVRILKLQDTDACEKVGYYALRVRESVPGRENGLLLCGMVAGCGKTTIAAALTQLLEEEMTYAPDGDSDFPFQGYQSAVVQLSSH